ncbi:carboxypeptidase-like regulatory domain-containing protein [Leeuwenhoekiella sp. MAR_2009_132]|uniref:carboxypeptidase-like regulatory domain-containing protein n=1 Tax=Leeuwenhoekiella sp. MAR_2009_132 TaxID=1392489 RepID=UPI00131EE7B4|nr:carboxypeptidase-like regulatory domain-containing protein [Leeuwenhoekiella sp. MAR_2009_132]
MNGTIINAENQKPIEFVNIGILNKNQGTITDPNGKFILTIPKKFTSDSITISHINYYSVNILAENFSNRIIALQPKTRELTEVVVSSKKRKNKKIGVKSYSRLLSMRVISKNNDIVEAAQRINIPNEEIKVKAVNFAIRKWSEVEGVKVRINFYKNLDDTPDEKIVLKNIVADLPAQTDSDWIRIDLNENDIYISKDFFVGIEFIPNFKKPTIVDLGGILTKGKGYYRENSLGSWTKLNGGASINVEIGY